MATSTHKTASNIYTIPHHLSFVDELSRYIVREYSDDENPLSLSKLLVIVPSRRGATSLGVSLRDAFLRNSGGDALLLPRIRAAADIGEDLPVILAELGYIEGVVEKYSRVISNDSRLFILADMIRNSCLSAAAANVLAHADTSYFTELNIEQSLLLAQSLASLLDEFNAAQISLEKLEEIVPYEYAEHWQLSLDAFKLIMREWPAYLAKHNAIDESSLQDIQLRSLAACFLEKRPDYPVIIAGSTGSHPAMVELMKAVIQLDDGKIILPGFDMDMPSLVWSALDETHPQYMMKNLLQELGVERQHVSYLAPHDLSDGESVAGRVKKEFLSEVMLPANMTYLWNESGEDVSVGAAAISADDKVLDMEQMGISYIECHSDEQEAVIVAHMLREVLEIPGKTAALVTNDRELAARVVSCMRFYRDEKGNPLQVDDSAGRPLLHSTSANFFMLVAEFCISPNSPVALLSLMKHPFCALRYRRADILVAARDIEVNILRKYKRHELDDILKKVRRSEDISHMSRNIIASIYDICSPLISLLDIGDSDNSNKRRANRKEFPLEDLITAHISVSEELANRHGDDSYYSEDDICLIEGHDVLWSEHSGGKVLRNRLSKILDSKEFMPTCEVGLYTGIIRVMLAKDSFRVEYGTVPRVHILSPIEARLQRYDRIILSGLNDGSWPKALEGSPWISEQMRKQLSLPISSTRIGQAAHDFYMLAMGKDVVLTRSVKKQGSPTVPSRWVLRLLSRLASDEEALASMRREQDKRISWANEWLRDIGGYLSQYCCKEDIQTLGYPAAMATPPRPSPPISSRPSGLSPTSLEMLIRNPYAVYAKYILGLKKLNRLGEGLGASDFGNAVHKALEKYYSEYPCKPPPDAYDKLIEFARSDDAFGKMLESEHVRYFWWKRFKKIAEWIVNNDEKQIAEGRIEVVPEKKLSTSMTINNGIAEERLNIFAIIDRIELYEDGRIAIIDYKTGQLPIVRDVLNGVACQLPLEAFILENSGIYNEREYITDNEKFIDVNRMEYWRLSGSREVVTTRPAYGSSGRGKDMRPNDYSDVAMRVETILKQIINDYYIDGKPYICCPDENIEPKYDDYYHLARRAEWQE